MTCPEVRQMLSELADGERDALPATALEHLSGCTDCRQAQEEYRQLDGDLNNLYTAGFAPGMAGKVRDRKSPRRHSAWAWSFGVAAAAVLLLTVGLFLMRRGAGPAGPADPGVKQIAQYSTGKLPVPADQAARFEVEGGTVWARAGSALTVRGPRQLELTRGACYFLVTPGQEKFEVRCPDGIVEAGNAQFSVTLAEVSTRVAVREGLVRLANASGALELRSHEAGEVLSVTRSMGAAPEKRSDVAVAQETFWRPWDSLSKEELAERWAALKQMLGDEDKDTRLEATQFISSAPAGNAEARQMLFKVVDNEKEQVDVRKQALASLGEIASQEDVEALRDRARGKFSRWPELQRTAEESMQKIQTRR